MVLWLSCFSLFAEPSRLAFLHWQWVECGLGFRQRQAFCHEGQEDTAEAAGARGQDGVGVWNLCPVCAGSGGQCHDGVRLASLLIVSLVLLSVLSLVVWLLIGERWFGSDR